MLCFVDFGVLEFQPDMQKSLHLAGSVRSNHTISIGALTTVLGQLACVSGGFNWEFCNLDEDTVQSSLLGFNRHFSLSLTVRHRLLLDDKSHRRYPPMC